ncbi:3442_t:CDS:2 [Rhizophagus irregularis]|nr:3442_t:CDS:2 [Rhizophagus irregularis]
MTKTSKVCNQEIDLDNLNLERSYTLEKFEYINSQLKNFTLEINRYSVNFFELDENGKLVLITKTRIPCGVITTSQGGFDFTVNHNTVIRCWSFQGAPFIPIFLVEISDIEENIYNSKFREVDRKFKEEFITFSTSVQFVG